MIEVLGSAEVRRIYGVVGDSPNALTEAMRKRGRACRFSRSPPRFLPPKSAAATSRRPTRISSFESAATTVSWSPIRNSYRGDIEKLQAKIARGRSVASSKRRNRGGQTKGGAGVAGRTVSTFRSMLGHAKRFGLIGANPALGVRVMASNKKLRRLSRDELARLGTTMSLMEEEGEHPTGLSAIRTMLLTGFRKMEVLSMQRSWIHAYEHSVRLPDTKAGQQVRVIGQVAVDLLLGRPARDNSPFVFPADWGDGHFIGVVRVLDRICLRARLEDVTPHVLRHTFASIAAELGMSELTIAGLLGHASRGVTQRTFTSTRHSSFLPTGRQRRSLAFSRRIFRLTRSRLSRASRCASENGASGHCLEGPRREAFSMCGAGLIATRARLGPSSRPRKQAGAVSA